MKIYDDRKFVLLAIFLIIGIIFVCRLFYLQVIDESYTVTANNQALQYVTQYPARGLIYDRNGELLVYNEAAYDLMVIPKDIKSIDTMEFCKLTGITAEQFKDRMQRAKDYSRYKESVFEKLYTADAFAPISEMLYRFPGFYGQQRTVRKYPMNAAAHVLGYIGEADNAALRRDSYYKRGDYLGLSGLEKAYEKDLRGQRGMKILMKDVHNRIKGSYKNGQHDTLAIPGTDIVSTLDAKLLQYGEKLMQNKKGSIVAIEPATGELLVLISSPGYNPNLLAGRDRTKNYSELLNNDSLVPLFNRATMASYSPGSVFKIIQALIGLQEGYISINTGFACNKALIGCHDHPSATNLVDGIKHSCNPYFHNVFKRIILHGESKSIFKDSETGLAKWRTYVMSFGLGQSSGLDLSDVKNGLIPGVGYYDKIYGKGRWAFSTIYSLSIGQGEVSIIPLQLASVTATIANCGYFYTPHLVRSVGLNGKTPEKYTVMHETLINQKHFSVAVEGMHKVVEEGTGRNSKVKGIRVCGKTGTVENPHGQDHAVFFAFAPKDDPKIAIAVYVENAGFGGQWAAPISGLMIEKYLTGTVTDTARENRILNAVILDPGKAKTKNKRH